MKLKIISKYPVKNQHPTRLLFIHGTFHGASGMAVDFSITSLNRAVLHMTSPCADTSAARDESTCAGLELPISSKMWQIRLSNCPARPFRSATPWADSSCKSLG